MRGAVQFRINDRFVRSPFRTLIDGACILAVVPGRFYAFERDVHDLPPDNGTLFTRERFLLHQPEFCPCSARTLTLAANIDDGFGFGRYLVYANRCVGEAHRVPADADQGGGRITFRAPNDHVSVLFMIFTTPGPGFGVIISPERVPRARLGFAFDRGRWVFRAA